MKPLLCIGTTPCAQRSMIFPKLTIDAVNRAAEVYEYGSGKSLNVARVLLTLGETPIATGFLGGSRGEFCRKQLAEIGLRHDFVTVSAPTRLCTTVIDSAAGTVTELVEESQAVEPAKWAELDAKIEMLLPCCHFAIFSGSLPPGAPADLYTRWLAVAERAGVRPIIDARGEPLRQAMRHHGAIIKVNLAELEDSLQTPVKNGKQLRQLVERACPPSGMIAVTNGAKGAVAWDGVNFCNFTPPSLDAINPIGSGDAFAAGMASGLAMGKSLKDACILATAAAASNAMNLQAGQIRRDQVDSFLDQIRWSSEM